MFDTKTPQQVRKLAKKSTWGAGLLTFFLTPVGYLYTGRKKLALITLAIWLPLILADVDDGPLSALLGFLIIGAPIENVMAIHKARGAAKELGISAGQEENASDLTVTLLRFAQEKGEVTMADCVIKTGKSPEELRGTLLEMEHQDLLRSGNRESDGAVVYRIV
ncbi:hypothetical protein [Nodosilinea sp. P-1105]|uniref:hypothetical protein n=1 Tax=Nodosilinea sp. P-1105 TaxID=2546229 RepID=UPI00146CFFC6|nr:hypothetical protein [Nodosilinea sp. P-1105]NMF86750.1 hypothetical protein [Nodosilinea sp. P-1105]